MSALVNRRTRQIMFSQCRQFIPHLISCRRDGTVIRAGKQAQDRGDRSVTLDRYRPDNEVFENVWAQFYLQASNPVRIKARRDGTLIKSET